MSAIDKIKQRIANRESLNKYTPNSFGKEYLFTPPSENASINNAQNFTNTIKNSGDFIEEMMNIKHQNENLSQIYSQGLPNIPQGEDFTRQLYETSLGFRSKKNFEEGKIGAGIADLLNIGIQTLGAPIILPYAVGSELVKDMAGEKSAEAIDEIVNIPFTVVGAGRELVGLDLGQSGNELFDVVGGIALTGGAIKGGKSIFKKKPGIKPKFEILPKENKPIEGLTQEKLPSELINKEPVTETKPKTGIEERTNKNGKKYYYDNDKKAVTSKKKFEEQQKKVTQEPVKEAEKPIKEDVNDINVVNKPETPVEKVKEERARAEYERYEVGDNEAFIGIRNESAFNSYSKKVLDLQEDLITNPELKTIAEKIRKTTNDFTPEQMSNFETAVNMTRGRQVIGGQYSVRDISEFKTLLEDAQNIKRGTFDFTKKEFTSRDNYKQPPQPLKEEVKIEKPVGGNEVAVKRMLSEGKNEKDIADALKIPEEEINGVKFGKSRIEQLQQEAVGHKVNIPTQTSAEPVRRTIVKKPSITQKRVFSDDVYKQDVDTIKNAPLTMGFDPNVNFAYLRAGAYHLENVIRSGVEQTKRFTTWSQNMIRDFGGGVKKRLFNIWAGIKRTFGKDMDGIKPEIPKDPNQIRAENIASKMTEAIRGSKRVRGETEKLYAEERGKRASQLRSALEKGKEGGEETLYRALGTQKGELPRADFEPIKLTQSDVVDAFKSIWNSKLSAYEQLNAGIGLKKVLGEKGGQIPTPNELKLLEKVFGGELVKELLNKRTGWEKAKENFLDVINIPRAIMSSIDFSATLRQGLILTTGYPRKAFNAFWQSVKAFGSDRVFQEVAKEIESRKNTDLYDQSGLYLSGKGESAQLTMREEAFMSKLKDKIPILGSLIKASERAYLTYLNKMRADVFDSISDAFISDGITPKNNPKAFKDLASFINNASGRGSLGKYGERIAPILNGVFFSPRNLMAKLNLLNPVTYTKLDPVVRKVAMKNMFKLVGAGISVLSLAELAGAKVEKDPRSSDFGKIRIGNTRMDIWGGFQQPIRFFTQLIMGQYKTTSNGDIYELDGEKFPFTTRGDLLLRFFSQKFSPQMQIASDVLRGKTQMGEELKLNEEVYSNLTPLYIQDAIESYNELGWGSVALSVPAILGVGLQTYDPKTRGRLIEPQVKESEIKQPNIKEIK